MEGKKYGKLLVIKLARVVREKRVRTGDRSGETYFHNKQYYLCKCDCGVEKEIYVGSLTKKVRSSKSCGCGRQESVTKHGMKGTRFYHIWTGMKDRCTNMKVQSYKRYGARGIIVCERWQKFENFRDDMYESYLKHCKDFGIRNTQIDRTNNDDNYTLENCRWVTASENARNRRERTRSDLGRFI